MRQAVFVAMVSPDAKGRRYAIKALSCAWGFSEEVARYATREQAQKAMARMTS